MEMSWEDLKKLQILESEVRMTGKISADHILWLIETLRSLSKDNASILAELNLLKSRECSYKAETVEWHDRMWSLVGSLNDVADMREDQLNLLHESVQTCISEGMLTDPESESWQGLCEVSEAIGLPLKSSATHCKVHDQKTRRTSPLQSLLKSHQG